MNSVNERAAELLKNESRDCDDWTRLFRDVGEPTIKIETKDPGILRIVDAS